MRGRLAAACLAVANQNPAGSGRRGPSGPTRPTGAVTQTAAGFGSPEWWPSPALPNTLPRLRARGGGGDLARRAVGQLRASADPGSGRARPARTPRTSRRRFVPTWARTAGFVGKRPELLPADPHGLRHSEYR